MNERWRDTKIGIGRWEREQNSPLLSLVRSRPVVNCQNPLASKPFGKTCIGRLPTAELPQTLQCEICKPPDRPQSQHASSDLTCEGFLTKWQDEQIPTRTTNTQCASRRTPMATQSEKREGLAVRHIAF